jgi:tetratricopeptide (TPR) repeat protein
MLAHALLVLTALAAAPATAPEPAAAAAQDRRLWVDSVRNSIERAHLARSADGVAAAGALAERALSAFPGDPLLTHYLGYARYREASLRTGPAVRPLLDAAMRDLEASVRRAPLAESHALLARIYARMSGLEPTRAAEWGEKAGDSRTAAERLGAQNPRVFLLLGSAAVYVPEQYGGGLDVAERLLTRALSLFPRDRPAAGQPAWGHAEAHAWMGEVQRRRGNAVAARASYDEALRIAPGYVWVSGTLIPGLSRTQR